MPVDAKNDKLREKQKVLINTTKLGDNVLKLIKYLRFYNLKIKNKNDIDAAIDKLYEHAWDIKIICITLANPDIKV